MAKEMALNQIAFFGFLKFLKNEIIIRSGIQVINATTSAKSLPDQNYISFIPDCIPGHILPFRYPDKIPRVL